MAVFSKHSPEGMYEQSTIKIKELQTEVKRLDLLLRRCWPAIWDWEYSDITTVIDKRQLLEDMDEFMCAEKGG